MTIKPKISFCTSCMGRLWQLKQTIKYNIELIKKYDCELCLVNYNSPDELDEFIKTEFSEELKNGTLIYVKTDKPKYFSASHAKNIAHMIANSQIVFNLDADNYVSEETIRYVYKVLSKDPNTIIHEFCGRLKDGSYGRIALSKENFIKLRGYDETMNTIQIEDVNLLQRAKICGLTYKNPFMKKIKDLVEKNEQSGYVSDVYIQCMSPWYKKSILNTKEDKIKFSVDNNIFPIYAENEKKNDLMIKKLLKSSKPEKDILKLVNPNGFGKI